MKILFDTSIIIAALIEDHPRYLDSLPWLQRVITEETQGVVLTHTKR